MKHPGSAGVSHSVRSLAEATGLSSTKIQRLINEERPTVESDEANRIAEAVDVRRRALFTPISSLFGDGDDRRRDPHGPRGPHDARPSRRSRQLGEHDRPGEPDGEGASRGERPL
ncbi:helix-turn-helix transcriptional regulator [Streptomyces sp. NPDC048389]|uniref:helix-turn-helix domain-containing protein n=1 Tax=Streptomyces sp. NPDC048389 TaxID=3154622 RepID=UPI003455185B